ncbi:MAG: response regulator [Cyanobacteriota bacterium]|mgnify:CR=1 FL=1
MKKKLNCIMLIDDDENDNFFHERAIKKANLDISVIEKTTAMSALEYLKSNNKTIPDLIFLDINMPCMNGWEFLDQYILLDKELKSQIVIVMLTTSCNPDDIEKAKSNNLISEYITKPLTHDMVESIKEKYFDSITT